LALALPPRPCRASSAGPRGLRCITGPRERFHSRFILLQASIRLQSPHETWPTPRRLRRVVPPMRFPASSRYPHPGPPSRWFPRHRRRPPSGFHNLSAVCSPSTFAGLFHPASTSRLSLQGFSLAGSRHGSSPRSCLLVVTARFAPLAGRSTRGSASRPCSPGESVATGPRLSEPSTRSPLGLPSSPGPASPRP
jgi:hypothetical protein